MKISAYVAIAGFAWLNGCDSTLSAQTGTSSETQTSLQELATRLDGLYTQGLAAQAVQPAARKLSSSNDSSTWTDLWANWTSVSYLKSSGQHSVFMLDSTSNTFTSANTYKEVRTNAFANGFTRSRSRSWWEIQSCGDSAPPPPHCRSSIPGKHQNRFGHTEFRNGSTLESVDSTTDAEQILDNRWIIRPNYEINDTANMWWDVIENGHLIGHGKQLGRSFSSTISEDTYINSLISMTIYDLSGNAVLPDKSKEGTWVAFPEDSMGFFIESVRIDASKQVLHIEFSWRCYPSPALVDSLAMLEISISDSTADLFSDFSKIYHQNPIRFPAGHSNLEIPLDSIRVKHPTHITLSLNNRIDLNVGTRAQTRFDFGANDIIAYPFSP